MKAALLFLFVFLLQALPAEDISADQIVANVNALMNQKSVEATMRMTIQTTSGQERTFEMKSWSKDAGQKSLVLYLKPARVKNEKILMLNNADDIWVYFARTNRVRKLASHAKKQKMQGSDFTYEDMGSGDAFLTQFTAKRLPDEKIEGYDCFKVELTRKPKSDSHYSRLVLYVIKENFLPVVIDYYDEDDPGRHLKRLVQSDIRVIDGVPTGMKMVMYNQIDNTRTSQEILEVKYNVQLDDEMFTERGLKK